MQQPYGRPEQRANVRLSVGWLVQTGGRLRCTTGLVLVVTVLAGLVGSCATAPASREDSAALVVAATSRLQQWRTRRWVR